MQVHDEMVAPCKVPVQALHHVCPGVAGRAAEGQHIGWYDGEHITLQEYCALTLLILTVVADLLKRVTTRRPPGSCGLASAADVLSRDMA